MGLVIDKMTPALVPAKAPPDIAQETLPKIENSGYGDAGASFTKNAFKGFTVESLSPKLDIDYHTQELRSRSRMMCISSPMASSAIKTLRTNVIGSGIIPKPRIDVDVLGITDEQAFEIQKQIEHEWDLWATNKNACDAIRVNDFYSIEQLIYSSFRMSGDSFCLFTYEEPTLSNPYGLRLHVIEADRISTPCMYPKIFTRGGYGYNITEGQNQNNGNMIYDGVEVDASGRIVAYWICSVYPYDYTEIERDWTRVEAFGELTGQPNILQIMESERPDQYRGVPILAPVMERILQTNRFGEAVVATATLHAKQTMVIETAGDPTINPFKGTGKINSTNARDIAIGNGAVNVLKSGEKMNAFKPEQPTTTYEQFIKTVGMEIGAGLEIPRGQLQKDFNSSYSATRGELLEFHKYVKMNQQWIISDFCKPVYEKWFTEAVARGRINAPNFFTDPLIRGAWLNCEWITPSFGQIDPTKELQALAIATEKGWITNENASRQYNGSDFYHNQIQLKQEQKAREGLTPAQTQIPAQEEKGAEDE